MSIQTKLIQLLSDGKFHSGEELGSNLNLTRSSIWKIMKQLSGLGITVHRIKGKGYQIPHGLDLLNKAIIYHYLSETAKKNIDRFEIIEKISSTNQFLLDELRSGHVCKSIALAEHQTQGRGRRGRAWHSPYGKNIYLSLGWHFANDPGELFGLSLVIAIAVVRALEKYGMTNLQLKWPNDILWSGRKLSGILLEMIAKPHIETSVVIGIGINVNMFNQAQDPTMDWIDIAEIIAMKPDRNKIIALVINELIEILFLFQQKGFHYFLSEWQQYDVLQNTDVMIHTGTTNYPAKVLGVSDKGELIVLKNQNERVRLLQGEVSVRPAYKT